ncbi:MAG TPA: tetratricopeptide repeat protein [Candidatus Baltobacteraceae bacterium]
MFNFLQRIAWFTPDPSPRARGLAALRRNDCDTAEALLGEAIAAAATSADCAFLFNKRGVARVRLGRRDDARLDFEAALALVDKFAPALTNIGNLLFEEGAVDEAIVYYEMAIRSDDGYAVAHLNLGVAYKKLGRYADSVRELRRANRIEGGALTGGRWFAPWRRRS